MRLLHCQGSSRTNFQLNFFGYLLIEWEWARSFVFLLLDAVVKRMMTREINLFVFFDDYETPTVQRQCCSRVEMHNARIYFPNEKLSHGRSSNSPKCDVATSFALPRTFDFSLRSLGSQRPMDVFSLHETKLSRFLFIFGEDRNFPFDFASLTWWKDWLLILYRSIFLLKAKNVFFDDWMTLTMSKCEASIENPRICRLIMFINCVNIYRNYSNAVETAKKHTHEHTQTVRSKGNRFSLAFHKLKIWCTENSPDRIPSQSAVSLVLLLCESRKNDWHDRKLLSDSEYIRNVGSCVCVWMCSCMHIFVGVHIATTRERIVCSFFSLVRMDFVSYDSSEMKIERERERERKIQMISSLLNVEKLQSHSCACRFARSKWFSLRTRHIRFRASDARDAVAVDALGQWKLQNRHSNNSNNDNKNRIERRETNAGQEENRMHTNRLGTSHIVAHTHRIDCHSEAHYFRLCSPLSKWFDR